MRQVTELATSDPQVRSRIEGEISRIMKGFSKDVVPPDLSNEFHRASEAISKNPDPFRDWKMEELDKARRAFSKVRPRGDLRGAVEIAAQGNAIDFFVDQNTLDHELLEEPRFAIDDIDELEKKLENASELLYLADNAGEVYFDMPLVNALSEHAKVAYAVKAAPVQNDLTLEDLRRVGLSEIFEDIVEAPATVGVYLEKASPDFRAKFDRADLVIAKGMGNYETLTELPQEGRFFYIFKAKCAPVARSLGVGVGDYVAMLR